MGGRFVLDRRHDKAQGLDRRSRASPFSVSLVTKNCCFGRESRGEPRWFIACQSCGEEVDVKAKGGDKVRKELDTKGDKAGIKKRPGYVWAKARQVVTKNTRLTRLPAGVVTGLIGNHAVYTMLGHHQCLVLV
jgi:hypothetical protein